MIHSAENEKSSNMKKDNVVSIGSDPMKNEDSVLQETQDSKNNSEAAEDKSKTLTELSTQLNQDVPDQSNNTVNDSKIQTEEISRSTGTSRNSFYAVEKAMKVTTTENEISSKQFSEDRVTDSERDINYFDLVHYVQSICSKLLFFEMVSIMVCLLNSEFAKNAKILFVGGKKIRSWSLEITLRLLLHDFFIDTESNTSEIKKGNLVKLGNLHDLLFTRIQRVFINVYPAVIRVEPEYGENGATGPIDPNGLVEIRDDNPQIEELLNRTTNNHPPVRGQALSLVDSHHSLAVSGQNTNIIVSTSATARVQRQRTELTSETEVISTVQNDVTNTQFTAANSNIFRHCTHQLSSFVISEETREAKSGRCSNKADDSTSAGKEMDSVRQQPPVAMTTSRTSQPSNTATTNVISGTSAPSSDTGVFSNTAASSNTDTSRNTGASSNTTVGSEPSRSWFAFGTNFEKPKYPEYKAFNVRVSSFNGWPHCTYQIPETMAKAGFFYTGSGDCARCFFCGGGLKNWEENDDPWVEHARQFPTCAFLRQNRVDNLVDMVLQEEATGTRYQAEATGTRYQAEATGYARKDELSAIVLQTLRGMGTDKSTINKAIERLRADRETPGQIIHLSELTAIEIYEVILQIEDENSARTLNDQTGISRETSGFQPRELTQTSTFNVADIARENEFLKRKMTCKVCMENPVAITSLPCGHLVCCENCAQGIRKCPVCYEIVTEMIRTFLCRKS